MVNLKRKRTIDSQSDIKSIDEGRSATVFALRSVLSPRTVAGYLYLARSFLFRRKGAETVQGKEPSLNSDQPCPGLTQKRAVRTKNGATARTTTQHNKRKKR